MGVGFIILDPVLDLIPDENPPGDLSLEPGLQPGP
jgi:hypothetical protein